MCIECQRHLGETLGRKAWSMAVYCKHENTKCAVHWKQTKATSQRQEHVHRQVTKRRSNDIRKRPKRSTESGERLACIDPNRRTIKLLKQRKDDVVTYQFVGLPKHIKSRTSRVDMQTHTGGNTPQTKYFYTVT